jgi:hypothetical protein
MTYAVPEERNTYRKSKIAANPTVCTICFKRDRREGKKTCLSCGEASKHQYVKHKEAYAELGRKRRTETPKGNISRMVTSAKQRAGGDITTDFIFQMWVEQDARCALSGIKMTWGGGKLQPNTLSMDRIDPLKGYFVDNVRLVCHSVNMFRGQMNDAELLNFAESIVKTLQEG